MKKHYSAVSFGCAWVRRALWVWAMTLGAFVGQAATVTLAWEPAQGSEVASYRIYWGTASGLYDRVLDVGLSTEAAVPNLLEGTTYFFTATSRDSSGLESLPSNEVAYTVPGGEIDEGGTGGGTGGELNSAPTVSDQSVALAQNSQIAITLIADDPDGDLLAYALISHPSHGVLSGVPPLLTYRPNAQFSGEDSFRYSVSDGNKVSTAATVRILVNPANGVPVASARTLSVLEDGFASVTLGGSDPEGALLSFTIVAPPTRGTLSGTPPTLGYRPGANFSGTDFFDFTVSDGQFVSQPARVSIVVSPVNDAPVASPFSVVVPQNGSVSVVLVGADVEGSPLAYAISKPPVSGTLTGSAPALTYRPAAGFSGSDAFEYTVSDGSLVSQPARVSIAVASGNTPPVALAQAVTVAEDTALSIRFQGQDADGHPLAYSVTRLPAYGTLSGTAPSVTYLPATNFFGEDSLQFRVNDGNGGTSEATVRIVVNPVNDQPVALPLSVTVPRDGSQTITLTGVDVDSSVLTYAVGVPPANGTLSVAFPNVTYTPRAGFQGDDFFEYSVSDGALVSRRGRVSILVASANSAPVAISQNLTTAENTRLPLTLTGSDPDGDVIAFTMVRWPRMGKLLGALPATTYLPNTNASGVDYFEFVARDASLSSVPARVTITVTPAVVGPVATPQTLTTLEDTALPVLLEGQSRNGLRLFYAISRPPTHGTLTGTPPAVTYLPPTNFFGTDSFEFRVVDEAGDFALAAVDITVDPVNDRPRAFARAVSMLQGGSVSITLGGMDVDGDPISFFIASPPSNGSLSGTPPNLTYRPEAGFSGSDSFEYGTSDGLLASSRARVSIQVEPSNTPPTAIAQAVTAIEDVPLLILLQGQDAESQTLAYSITRQPTRGTLVGVPPAITYLSHTNTWGADSLEFRVDDGNGGSAVAQVQINVLPVDDPPVAHSQSLTLAEDTVVTTTLTGSDPDGTEPTLVMLRWPAHGTLSGTLPSVTYRPHPNYYGPDSFQFAARDATRTSAPATVSISVTPVNDPPTVSPLRIALSYGSSSSFVLSGSDPEDSPLMFRVVTPPVDGTLSGTPPALTYIPRPGYSGQDYFVVVANDGSLDSVPNVVRVLISLVLASGDEPATITGAGMQSTSAEAVSDPGSGLGDGGSGDPALGDAPVEPPTVEGTEPVSEVGTLDWVDLPVHGRVEYTAAGDIVYEHAGDGSTLDSFCYAVSPTGEVGSPTPVALHIVGIQNLTRADGSVAVSFPMIAGLTYRVEVNDVSPTAQAPWQVVAEVVPTEPRIASIPVSAPGNDVPRFIRIWCVSTTQQVVSEVWGMHAVSVEPGMDGRVYSLPFQGVTRLRARVGSVEGNVLGLDAGVLEFPDFRPVDGNPTHAVFVGGAVSDNPKAGSWWLIRDQAQDRIVVDESIESLADCVAHGEALRIVRLRTVAEVFGKAGSLDGQLQVGDRVKLEGFMGEDDVLSYLSSDAGQGEYWLDRGGVVSGPFDGTTLPLLPFQSFYFLHRAEAGSLLMHGRVHAGAAVQYFHPGAQLAGNGFPLPADPIALAPYHLADTERPWMDPEEVQVLNDHGDLGAAPAWVAPSGDIPAGGGVWLHVPESAGVVRWAQPCPWN